MIVRQATTSNGWRLHVFEDTVDCWCQPRERAPGVFVHRDVVCGRYVRPTMAVFSGQ